MLLEDLRHLPLASGFLCRSLGLRGCWRWRRRILAQAGECSQVEALLRWHSWVSSDQECAGCLGQSAKPPDLDGVVLVCAPVALW